MFTGIIRHLGEIKKVVIEKGVTRLSVASSLAASLVEGASLAVNGVCLTALSNTKRAVSFQLMEETLKRTNLGELQVGSVVNLEQPLGAGQPIDGHFVLGHIDGKAIVTSVKVVKEDKIFTFKLSQDLMPYLIPKGSVALDGVSLTVVDVFEDTFTVSMMPYTLEHTLFGRVRKGYQANIEVDVLGKYVARFMKHKLPAV